MCLYEPPPLLGWPDLSAAMVCAIPLSFSAARWDELLRSFAGLAVAFLVAHVVIMAMHHSYPPSVFYWVDQQVGVVPISLATIGYVMTVLFALSRALSGLWQGDYRRGARQLLLALALVAVVAGWITYLVLDARASEAASVPQEVPVIANCIFPPFGEGATGYTMLAVLIVFEILVAVAIADALSRTSYRRSK